MRSIPEESFTKSLFRLLEETFEGPAPGQWSVFLDSGGGLFQLLEQVDAAEASRAPKVGAPSVAAHTAHALYYVDILQSYMRKAPVRADWPGSWRTQQVDEAEWKALKARLREAFEAASAGMRAIDSWTDESVGGAMAIVVHTAYHLAAIRTILRLR